VRWLVTGAAGQLGTDLHTILTGAAQASAEQAGAEQTGAARPGGSGPGDAVTALRRADLDITDAAAVDAAVAGHDVVVNAAAWTDVDGAEADEAAATAINGTGPAVLAAACARHGARLIHVSTDYVFAGDATAPYAEDSPTDPVNAYGRSKLAGERAVLDTLPDTGYVVRTAWLYSPHGKNFLTTMLRLAEARDTVSVVTDQIGQPTWTYALAERLVVLGNAALGTGTPVGAAPAGVYHGTASGQTSWHGFARAIFAWAGLDPERVLETTAAEFARPAPRPAYSVLGHDRWAAAGLAPLPDWAEMLGTVPLPATAPTNPAVAAGRGVR
jgi:dTDP-4-dehydrorhamnose reductase